MSLSLKLFLATIACLTATISLAKEDLQIGLSNETIAITSNFSGTDIVVFGSIENGSPELLKNRRYDIVVVLTGPREDLVVRRKERVLGIWINRDSQVFGEVPSSYSLAATNELELVSESRQLKTLQIGADNLNFQSYGILKDANELSEFRESLIRLKTRQELYLERIGGVEFLSPTLYRARIAVPANVPIGAHRARAYLFKDGKLVLSKATDLRVKKIGFEQMTYTLAHTNGLIYGILAVAIAMATGWLASVVFRKD